MPYAADDRISKAPLAGGVEISEQEYSQARDHLLSGKLVRVHAGQMFLTEKPEKLPDHEEPVWQDGEWHHEPIAEPEKTPEQLISEINRQRKAAERHGINYNGIRYAGSPEDRQAMDEAVTFAEDAGITEFSAWKDSDNEFHANHPVADVVEAYRLIGQNRMRLIELEGQYISQVQIGELTDADGLDWS